MDEKQDVVEVGTEIQTTVPASDMKQSIVPTINTINLLDEKQVAAAKVFLTQIMRSKKGGISSVEDGLAILMRAQDLNLPFSSCIENIHVINGKTGIDIHIIKSLLLKAGVWWECIEDYAPQYEYTDINGLNVYAGNKLPDECVKCRSKADAENKQKEDDNHIYVYPVLYYQDYNGNVYKSSQWNNALAVAMNAAHAKELIAAKKIPVFKIVAQPIDYVTKYKLHRFVNNHEMTSIGSFSYSEAVSAGMFEKDTYVKYARIMIGHRAFTYAARDIASDVLMGCYETNELRLANGLGIDDVQFAEEV